MSEQQLEPQIEVGSGWYEETGTVTKGAAYQEETLLKKEEIAEQLSNASSVDEVCEIAKTLNGFWSSIHRIGDHLVIIVDQIQSIPVYYSIEGGKIYSSSNDHWIERQVGCLRNELTQVEYLLSGYVTGCDTLNPAIKQVPAGNIAVVNLKTQEESYQELFKYRPGVDAKPLSHLDLHNEYESVVEASVQRLINYADGRPIAISLSSGYDSRLIATMLTRLGYDNIISFSYTYRDESKLAKKTAAGLGIKHIDLQFDHNDYQSWYHSSERESLEEMAGTLGRHPTITSAPVFYRAREGNLLPTDSVIVTGDTPSTTGEHITYTIYNTTEYDIDLLIDEILDFHYTLWPWDDDLRSDLRQRVRHQLKQFELSPSTNRKIIESYERWDWRERQAKHILRPHLYEYGNYDWWYPLWDREYMDLWRRVPLDSRYERQLHESYIEDLYAEVSNLSMKKASETYHTRNPWVVRIDNLVTGTPIENFANKIYRQHINPMEYGDYPMFGMMDEEQFYDLQRTKQNVHAYRVLDILGIVSYESSDNGLFPEDGVISKRWVEETLPLESPTTTMSDI